MVPLFQFIEVFFTMAFKIKPPLVSVIVSSFNYDRFLEGTIASVRSQNYPAIECIVVDDCSSDDSVKIIEKAVQNWPELRTLCLTINKGQSSALLEGLALATGDFVLFLDSDDILFPDCIAYHVAVHMCSRRSVGFTCCDAMQIYDERMVMAHDAGIASSLLDLSIHPNLISKSVVQELSSLGIDIPNISFEQIRYVDPMTRGWPWSTTSTLLFRKDALELVCGAAGLTDLRTSTDNFLCHSINLLTGSIIIDKQLVGYRIHGKNQSGRRLALDFLRHDAGKGHTHQTFRIFLDHIMSDFVYISKIMRKHDRIFDICVHVDVPGTGTAIPRWQVGSRFASLLVTHRSKVASVIGYKNLVKWILKATILFWYRRIKAFAFRLV